MIACDSNCDRDLVCDSISTFQDDSNLLESISLVTPNAIVDVEEVFNFVHLGHIGLADPKKIESYEIKVDMNDVFSFHTSNPSFIIDGSLISIPKDVVLQGANYVEEFADFTISIFLEGESGFIHITGEVLFVTCASLLSGDVDIKDCRYSYQISPSYWIGDPPLICQ